MGVGAWFDFKTEESGVGEVNASTPGKFRIQRRVWGPKFPKLKTFLARRRRFGRLP